MTATDSHKQSQSPSSIPEDVFLIVALSHVCLAIPVSLAVFSNDEKNFTLTLNSENLYHSPLQWDDFFSCTLPYKLQYNCGTENKDTYIFSAKLVEKKIFEDKLILHMLKKDT